jgi:RNA polymerase sigma factor (sigma-70 family)
MRTADGYIISKCLNDGDSTAFGLLVDKYKASIYALACSKLHNFHDAEDVTQEVFVKAYRNLRKLRRWDNFFAWLYSITSNLCKDFLQEDAYSAYSKTFTGRYLFVVFIYKLNNTGIVVSARDMSPRERRYYNDKKKS